MTHSTTCRILDKAIANASFFMEKGGVLLFDMNTPYKHQEVLGENCFTFEQEDARCIWKNHYDPVSRRVEVSSSRSTIWRRGSSSMRTFLSIHIPWSRCELRWKTTVLHWKASVMGRALAR